MIHTTVHVVSCRRLGNYSDLVVAGTMSLAFLAHGHNTDPKLLLDVVMFIYEYSITLREEISLFWMRKWSVATVLFLLNRYLVLGETIVSLVGLSTTLSDQVRPPCSS